MHPCEWENSEHNWRPDYLGEWVMVDNVGLGCNFKFKEACSIWAVTLIAV